MKKILTLSALLFSMNVLASTSASITSTEQYKCSSDSCKAKIKDLHEYAVNGSPEAQILIAFAFLQGDGFEQDVERGLKWLKKAKRNGSNKATWILSHLYREGAIIEKDESRADYLLDLAVKRKFAPALYEKAAILLSEGSEAEKKTAVKYLKLSKAKGFDQARYLYATLLESSSYVKQDLYQAAMTYRNLGNYRDAKERLINITENDAKALPENERVKFEYLTGTEVITVTGDALFFEEVIDYLLVSLRANQKYDGEGGMSHIVGRVCNLEVSCRFLSGEAQEEFVRELNRGAIRTGN